MEEPTSSRRSTLRRKLDVLEGRAPAPVKAVDVEVLPLFPEVESPVTGDLVACV